MRIYVIERNFGAYDWCKRVGALHDLVFHGIGEYRSLAEWKPYPIINEEGERSVAVRPPEWRWPGTTNTNREPLHVARSGEFVPDVFGSMFTFFVVSAKVREALSSFPNVAFNRVIFEHLVDLPMPSLGDFSWIERDDLDRYKSVPKNLIRTLPHVAKFEKVVA